MTVDTLKLDCSDSVVLFKAFSDSETQLWFKHLSQIISSKKLESSEEMADSEAMFKQAVRSKFNVK